MKGVALTTEEQLEIIASVQTGNKVVLAVAAAPGWNVIGEFYLPVGAPARLEAIGAVSDASLAMTVRLFDLADVAAISGSPARLTALSYTRVLSGLFDLLGGRTYQIQAQVVGNLGDTYFGSVNATLV